MLKVGITGGIGSGKSTVARIFALLNIPVYDADGASKRLYRTNTALQIQLKKHFGDAIYEQDVLNTKALARIVFNDPQALLLLNSLVHPLTIKDAEKWISKQDSPYIIKEAALLFESHSAEKLDYIIGVKAPEDIRIARASQRDGLDEAEVRSRLTRQMNEEEKLARCDFIIDNSEQILLIPQVLQLHTLFLNKADASAASLLP